MPRAHVFCVPNLCFRILTYETFGFQREEEFRGLGGLTSYFTFHPFQSWPTPVTHVTRDGPHPFVGVTLNVVPAACRRWLRHTHGVRVRPTEEGRGQALGPRGRRGRRLNGLLGGRRRWAPRRSGSWAATLFWGPRHPSTSPGRSSRQVRGQVREQPAAVAARVGDQAVALSLGFLRWGATRPRSGRFGMWTRSPPFPSVVVLVFAQGRGRGRHSPVGSGHRGWLSSTPGNLTCCGAQWVVSSPAGHPGLVRPQVRQPCLTPDPASVWHLTFQVALRHRSSLLESVSRTRVQALARWL